MKTFSLAAALCAALAVSCFAGDGASPPHPASGGRGGHAAVARNKAKPPRHGAASHRAKAAAGQASAQAQDDAPDITLFYTYDCEHCLKAKKWLDTFAAGRPGLRAGLYEIKKSASNRALFEKYAAKHGLKPASVPVFFVKGGCIAGFTEGRTDVAIEAALQPPRPAGLPAPQTTPRSIIPLFGAVDPLTIPLVKFTAVAGFLDGLSPCSMWALMFLAGLLTCPASRRQRLAAIAVFSTVSAAVYFAFMVSWLKVFLVLGFGRWITVSVGCAAAAAGAVYLRELLPADSGGLVDRIRALEIKMPVSLAAVAALAALSGLVSLGCTAGVPAIFEKLLSVRRIPAWQQYWLTGVYSVLYATPLTILAVATASAVERHELDARQAGVFRILAGALMVFFGLMVIIISR
ncbi:MAG: hypothetical protein WC421_10495 [Elusimicrobiales bacterium]